MRRAIVIVLAAVFLQLASPRPAAAWWDYIEQLSGPGPLRGVDVESRVVAHEAGVSAEMAQRLVKVAEKVRNLKNHGLEEGVSTRLLIYAATLIKQGVPADRACEVAIARPITDDPDMMRSIIEVVKAIF